MKKSRFAEEQIIAVLKEEEAGVAELRWLRGCEVGEG
jgi:hypothetical protein